MVYPHTVEIFVDILSDLGKTGIYAFIIMFQMSKTNSFNITRMFTLFINKAFNFKLYAPFT